MTAHHFFMKAIWNGGRLGTGEIQGKEIKTAISVPGELGGPGVGTNPEELLIGSAMNCYIITLAAILDKRKIPIQSLSLQSEGILTTVDGNLGFRQIIHRPTIVLLEHTEKMMENAHVAAHRADQVCMISKALRGNVEISVEPIIERAATE